jgi:hypothetical protein
MKHVLRMAIGLLGLLLCFWAAYLIIMAPVWMILAALGTGGAYLFGGILLDAYTSHKRLTELQNRP